MSRKRAVPATIVATGSPMNILFPGFDDHMEEREPGYKARQAAERAERHRREEEYRASVVAKYGSVEAALAPSPPERALLAATAHLERKAWKEFANGRFRVDTLDGWDDPMVIDEPPARVVEAVSNAYPLPQTVVEAAAEVAHWEMREQEITAAGHYQHDYVLSLACELRRHLVRKLYESGLPAHSVDDVHARLKLAARSEVEPPADTLTALLSDFERVVMGRDPAGAPVAEVARESLMNLSYDAPRSLLAIILCSRGPCPGTWGCEPCTHRQEMLANADWIISRLGAAGMSIQRAEQQGGDR